MKNKQELQNQIEDMKQKLAEMEALLNQPEVGAYYWQPKEDDAYYYVTYLGNISRSWYTRNFQGNKTRYRVFKTKEEAQKYAEYVKAEETLRRVIAEVNAGWLPDWNNDDSPKYIILYRCDLGRLRTDSYRGSKLLPNFMYIKSKELAEKLKEEYEAEFKTYLSY